MGRGIVKVSTHIIEQDLFGGEVQIVGVRDFDEAGTIEFLIEGPGLPKVNDLGLPRPVVCEVTERFRSYKFKAID